TSPWGYKYNYGLTNAIAIINATQAKWLNLTFMEYSLINYSRPPADGRIPIASLYIPFNSTAGLYYTWMNFRFCYPLETENWIGGYVNFSGLLPLSTTGKPKLNNIWDSHITTLSYPVPLLSNWRVMGIVSPDWQVENIDINLFNHYVLMYIYQKPFWYSYYNYTTKGWILVANFTYIIAYSYYFNPYAPVQYKPINFVPLQGYPIFIVVPENVYLLEISYN
ncbi:MAG: hypothetical protein RXR59_04250, partial [Sulfolobus sp.]